MNMELWAATFLRFAALLHFIFLPFFSGRSIPAMAKVTVGLALSITVVIKWMSLTSRQFGTLRLMQERKLYWIITFKNCRNAVEHSKNGRAYFRL